MTTNDTEYLKDDTGNRRWLIVKMPEDAVADIEWLKENREQLFAEAYARREEPTWKYPEDRARELQEESREVDPLEDKVIAYYQVLSQKIRDEGITINEVYEYIYKDKERFDPVIPKPLLWRLNSIFKGVLKLQSKRLRRGEGGNNRQYVWFPTKDTNIPIVQGYQHLDFENDV